MRIEILRNNNVIASSEGRTETYLVFQDEYIEGDAIRLTELEKGFITLQLDAVLGRTTLFTNGQDYIYPIPFAQKHDCYHDAVYRGTKHFLWVRKAHEWETGYRNLSLNPYDGHENTSLFPHAKANIETRGESVFAARNAIDGIVASNGHGTWPWSSWGINRDPNAELTIDFGHSVSIDRLIFYTRADFPHDAWWTEATITFSRNREMQVKLEKKDGPQEITFPRKTTRFIKLSNLIKADDPSPFPALIQLEVYGKDA